MENQTLPLPTSPNYSYETALSGVEFKFHFIYSTREACWHLTMSSLSGDLIISNIRLVPWIDLLHQYVATSLPQGALALIPVSEEYPKSKEITLENLATDFVLFYLPEQ